ANPYLSASFFFSSRRRHTRFSRDWSSDVCSSDLHAHLVPARSVPHRVPLRHPTSTCGTSERGRVPRGREGAPGAHGHHPELTREEVGVDVEVAVTAFTVRTPDAAAMLVVEPGLVRAAGV